MRVLFATAELVPLAKVGGLAEASAGLVRALRDSGIEVEVVMPDYGSSGGLGVTEIEPAVRLDAPAWCGEVTVRRVMLAGFGAVTLVGAAGLRRPHPYVDPESGWGWPDNDHRFLAFSAVVALLAIADPPDVVHVNDWHTAATLAWLPPEMPTVLTVHNLSHQGQCDRRWLDLLGPGGAPFDAGDHVNLLAGGIRAATRVVAVSKRYAEEIREPLHGCGLDELLRSRGDALVGIRNGIDVDRWNPADDPHLLTNYDADDLAGKELCAKELQRFARFDEPPGNRAPIVGLVARFVDQKGVDLAVGLAPYLEHLPAKLVLLGAGEPQLTAMAEQAEMSFSSHVWFARGYDDALAHQLIAGSDLLLVPSRFEPCGLTQMEALTYGTIPVVTDVGGLHDTVIDADADPRYGTGFVAAQPTTLDLLDALHRAVRAWSNKRRRVGIQTRGMRGDWSWRIPAGEYRDLYRSALNHG